MTRQRFIIIAAVLALTPATVWLGKSAARRLAPARTIADRLDEHGSNARARLRPHFERAAVAYPPKKLTLVGLKAEKQLQVYGAGDDGKHRFLRAYPILAASGGAGPKLKEGDRQVPEGIYPVESLNPNSRFHLSLRVGYPNAFDREQARLEGRENLGGDIMIHGKAVSIGCLAMGDEAAEDLFVLAADTGLPNITVILAPVDFRLRRETPPSANPRAWTLGLYQQLSEKLRELPAAP